MATFDSSALDRRRPGLIRAVLPFVERLNRHYFSLRVEGTEHLRAGPVLYVGNHNGGIMGPDLFCTLATLWRTLGPETPLYALAHDFAMRQFTPLGRFLQAVGAIRASRGNAERALTSGASVLVYPGGDIDAYRHFSRRNEVVILPRTGFVRIAQQCGVPIVPIVAYGAHRSAIIFHEGKWLAELLRLQRWARLERFPLALALPWGLALGPWTPYLPLPLPVHLRILPAIAAPAEADPRALATHVEHSMQHALTELATQ